MHVETEGALSAHDFSAHDFFVFGLLRLRCRLRFPNEKELRCMLLAWALTSTLFQRLVDAADAAEGGTEDVTGTVWPEAVELISIGGTLTELTELLLPSVLFFDVWLLRDETGVVELSPGSCVGNGLLGKSNKQELMFTGVETATDERESMDETLVESCELFVRVGPT